MKSLLEYIKKLLKRLFKPKKGVSNPDNTGVQP